MHGPDCSGALLRGARTHGGPAGRGRITGVRRRLDTAAFRRAVAGAGLFPPRPSFPRGTAAASARTFALPVAVAGLVAIADAVARKLLIGDRGCF